MDGYEIIYDGESYIPVISNNTPIKSILDGSLTELTDLGGATSLMSERFRDFTSLEVLSLAGVADVPAYTCYNCSGLTSLMLGNNIAQIGKYAFWGCSSVRNFNLVASLSSLGTYAFYDFGSNRPSPSDDVFRFDLRDGTLANVRQYSFGGSIASVRNENFNIFFPNTITEVGSYTFGYANWFNIFFTSENVPTVQSTTFLGSTNIKIFVPYSKVNTYRTATNWSVQSGIIYGWAEENNFELNDILPVIGAEGFGLTWYDDLEMTHRVMKVTDPMRPLYCKASVGNSAIVSKIRGINCSIVVTNAGQPVTEGTTIAIGSELIIEVLADEGYPYFRQLVVGEESILTDTYTYVLASDEPIIIRAICWDGINEPANLIFGDNTTEQIADALDNNNHTIWDLGDVIDIPIGEDTFSFRIISITDTEGHYGLAGGGSSKMILEMSEVYEMRVWNTPADNRYETSSIRQYLNTTVYNLFDNGWKSIIKETIVPNVRGGPTSGQPSTILNLTEKVFLPSKHEITGATGGLYTQEMANQSQFEFYKSSSQGSTERIKKDKDGVARSLWTRSPSTNSAIGRIVSIGTSGGEYTQYVATTQTLGVSFLIVL